ncbi:hypothetical protein L208DRAFT_747693 [Tricholoma matsutake]|nr:hypothetical protein L208DRAFT_747693 [Tricholoma matsutake 945]
MGAQPVASRSRHPAPAQHRLQPKVPAITVTPRPRVVESSSGSDDKFRNEEGAEESDSGEDEIEESDTATNSRKRHKRDTTARARAPLRGNLRTTPCARCVRLKCECWEQVNGKTACYYCGHGKVRCDPEDEDQVSRKKTKKESRRKTKRTRFSSEHSREESPRRFT